MLSGYKTYIIAAAIVIHELLGYLLGYSNTVDAHKLLEALGLAALRAGVGRR